MDSECPQSGQHYHRCVRSVHAILTTECESSLASRWGGGGGGGVDGLSY